MVALLGATEPQEEHHKYHWQVVLNDVLVQVDIVAFLVQKECHINAVIYLVLKMPTLDNSFSCKDSDEFVLDFEGVDAIDLHEDEEDESCCIGHIPFCNDTHYHSQEDDCRDDGIDAVDAIL
eukprot:689169-Ditylum_brightwellii.AAC.1